MSALVDQLTALKEAGDYAGIARVIPYSVWLGLGFEERDGRLLGKLSYSEMLVGNPLLPALHGGTLGALLESTAIFEIMWRQESLVLPKTINVTIDYLRSGRPVDTFASATITKHGRRVVAVRADAWQEDRNRLIATANAHFLVVAQEDRIEAP
jgi:acyl-coenzyme A thioesterase PaaI-like protein